MTIARRLKWYLDVQGVDYELVHHAHATSSSGSARAAKLPGGKVAKSVVLEDERGYVLALVPASCRVLLDEIRQQLDRDLQLASETELRELFSDCEVGAVPAVGAPYNVPTVIDDSLLRLPDLYFEAGDHRELVHMSGPAFRDLFAGVQHGRFCKPH